MQTRLTFFSFLLLNDNGFSQTSSTSAGVENGFSPLVAWLACMCHVTMWMVCACTQSSAAAFFYWHVSGIMLCLYEGHTPRTQYTRLAHVIFKGLIWVNIHLHTPFLYITVVA